MGSHLLMDTTISLQAIKDNESALWIIAAVCLLIGFKDAIFKKR